MTEFVYNRLTEQPWLEDTPEYYKDEYYCPQAEAVDSYLDEYPTFEELKERDLIFPEWEVKQQEMFVDGLGNENKRGFSTSYIGTSKIYEALAKLAKEKNVCIVTAKQGVKDFQPRILDSVSSVGIEYTPLTYKYIKRRKI